MLRYLNNFVGGCFNDSYKRNRNTNEAAITVTTILDYEVLKYFILNLVDVVRAAVRKAPAHYSLYQNNLIMFYYVLKNAIHLIWRTT